MIGEPQSRGARLAVRDVSLTFPNGVMALRGVSLAVNPGELVVILGANGCGKSTLLRCIARLLQPSAGAVEIDGRDILGLCGEPLRQARSAIAFVTQQANLVRRRSVLANVACGTLGRHRSLATALGMLPSLELDFAREQLRVVGLTEKAAQRAGTLSGGQAQRVSIGRALAQRPRVLLADEPVASLDPDASVDVLALVRRLADAGLAVACVLHQPELALRFADRIVGIRGGVVAFDAPASAVTPVTIAALYGAPAAAQAFA